MEGLLTWKKDTNQNPSVFVSASRSGFVGDGVGVYAERKQRKKCAEEKKPSKD